MTIWIEVMMWAAAYLTVGFFLGILREKIWKANCTIDSEIPGKGPTGADVTNYKIHKNGAMNTTVFELLFLGLKFKNDFVTHHSIPPVESGGLSYWILIAFSWPIAFSMFGIAVATSPLWGTGWLTYRILRRPTRWFNEKISHSVRRFFRIESRE